MTTTDNLLLERPTRRSTAIAPTSDTTVAQRPSRLGQGLERTVAVAAMPWAGLMGGIFYAFSVLVMPGLDATNQLVAIPAMQNINDAVDSRLFGLGFFGAAILAALAMITGILRRDGFGSALMIAAGLVYLVGTFLVTVAFNVPLNDDLDGYSLLDPSSLGLTDGYIRDWSRWNDIRTVSSLVAFVLFASAALLPRRSIAMAAGRPVPRRIAGRIA